MGHRKKTEDNVAAVVYEIVKHCEGGVPNLLPKKKGGDVTKKEELNGFCQHSWFADSLIFVPYNVLPSINVC